MNIFWMPEATANLADFYAYIHEENPAAADRQRILILDAVSRLAAFPEMGRLGRIVGTRELSVPGTSYIVAYRIRSRSIQILAVLHGARCWPRKFRH